MIVSWDDKRLEKEFGIVNKKLDEIDLLLRGEGQEDGLKGRVGTLERHKRFVSRVLWFVCPAIGSGLCYVFWILLQRMRWL